MTETPGPGPIKVKLHGRRFAVTADMILAALDDYDAKYRKADTDSGNKYVLIHQGRHYPPKRIIKLALGWDAPVSGGEGRYGANKILRDLRFTVEPLVGLMPAITEPTPTVARTDPRLSAPPPVVEALVDQFFAQRWANLHQHYQTLPDGHYPGVYVLARSASDLAGQPIREADVYYVGMSQSSLRGRLRQFVRGLEDGGHHSGARRYFHEVGSGKAYQATAGRPMFFVAAVAVPCLTEKAKRQALDLRKLGEVCRLEYYVLARIKEKLGVEPELNRK